MSFKTIAVHLDDGPRCAIRVALAASLATRFEGKLRRHRADRRSGRRPGHEHRRCRTGSR